VTIITGATDYDTYAWNPTTGVTGDATNGWTFNPTETTTYTLTASQSAGTCATSVDFVVNVNEAPVMTVSASATSICVGESVELEAGSVSTDNRIPTVTSGDGSDFINNFSFDTIVNNSSGQSTAQYGDFTAMSANVTAGQDYTISMQSGSGSSQIFKVWIDYDQSGTFDASEVVYSTTSGSTAVQTGSVTISSTALNGATRMRVGSRWNTALTDTQACANPGYGEYEDYTVVISGGVDLYTYSWSDGTSVIGTTANLTLTPVATTTYTVTATGTNGCIAIDSVTITVSDLPTIDNITASATEVCEGAEVTFEVP